MTRTAGLALALFTLSALAAPSEAKTLDRGPPGSTVTAFCGDRVCPVQTVSRARREASPPPALRKARQVERRSVRPPPPGRAAPETKSTAAVAAPAVEAGSGVVRSGKTGATARVSPRWSGVFQAYVDDLEARGAAVYYMGGYRRGRCSVGSQHPCGSALDVCQDHRGHVSGARNCNLPGPVEMAAIASRHGLFEGGVWCRRPDYGHVQAIASGSVCEARGSSGLLAARRHGRKVASHHARGRVAHREVRARVAASRR